MPKKNLKSQKIVVMSYWQNMVTVAIYNIPMILENIRQKLFIS